MTSATTPTTVDEDGDLIAALDALTIAVSGLCSPQITFLDSKVRQAPSLYMQLFDAVSGEQAQTGSGTGSKSRPPFWTDAFDVKNEIDVRLEIEQPAFQGVPASVGRMRELLKRKWRPQDVHKIDQLTEALNYWATKIVTTLTPERKWSLPNACPNCQKSMVRRVDSAGEVVRQPALQITTEGCICANCKYVWGVERFQILAAALRQDAEQKVMGVTVGELIEKLSKVAPDTLVVTTESTAFRYITEFTARTVQAAITSHHAIGTIVQKFDDKWHKTEPVSIVVLSHQPLGEEI